MTLFIQLQSKKPVMIKHWLFKLRHDQNRYRLSIRVLTVDV